MTEVIGEQVPLKRSKVTVQFHLQIGIWDFRKGFVWQKSEERIRNIITGFGVHR